MIYDKETDRYYLNDFHLKNSKGAMESLKKQKPFSWEGNESSIPEKQEVIIGNMELGKKEALFFI